jgi:lipopolysaccharide/colanic/teichoic acid biosynthesis glycosyltransferase
MDIIISLLLLLISSPVMLIVALLIKLYDRGPVFYKQKRYTYDSKVFNLIKFRSMIVDAEKDGPQYTVDNDPRVTPIGRFIRAARIDELPQLFNILVGDMSLVGPRAERVENLDKYASMMPEFKYRLKVKAGLTGLAQLYGKYNTSFEDKARMDIYYIVNHSLLLDIKLMLYTIKILFSKESTHGFDESVVKNKLNTSEKKATESGNK